MGPSCGTFGLRHNFHDLWTCKIKCNLAYYCSKCSSSNLWNKNRKMWNLSLSVMKLPAPFCRAFSGNYCNSRLWLNFNSFARLKTYTMQRLRLIAGRWGASCNRNLYVTSSFRKMAPRYPQLAPYSKVGLHQMKKIRCNSFRAQLPGSQTNWTAG